MRRRACFVLTLIFALLCACAGGRETVSVALENPDRDSAVQALMDALCSGRETLSVTVSPQAAEDLDCDALSTLFATAHYNDACDLSIYPASRSSTYTAGEDGGYTMTFSLDYGGISARDYARCQTEYAAMLDEYAAELEKLGEAPKKLYRTIYFLVCQHTQYDYALAEETLANSTAIKTADALKTRGPYGAMVQRKSICTGYAMLYKALCDRMGLPCWVVIGQADSITHAWNLIIVDGDIRYIDTTNGDRDSEPNADFCLLTPTRYRTLGRQVDPDLYIPTMYYDAGYRD